VTCSNKEYMNCPYNNSCYANIHGFADSDCCPAVLDSCPEYYRPFLCGTKQCRYDNISCATAAGFKVKDCCPAVEDVCTKEHKPVTCGWNECPYENASCAVTAGFNAAEECKKVECTNDKSFQLKNNKKCAWIGNGSEKRRSKHCKNNNVRMSCPVTCGICCEDDPTFTFKINRGVMKGCDWIDEKKPKRMEYCKKLYISSSCPIKCDDCKRLYKNPENN